jgi:oligosaccharide repeat unit polymerase
MGQAVACGTLLAVLWWRRGGRLPWFEIGVVYSAVVLVYGTYPLIKFFVLGPEYFAPQSDGRWSALRPSSDEVAAIAWCYVAHLAAFAVTYLAMRGRLPEKPPEVQRPGLPVMVAALVAYVLIQVFWVFLGVFYDTSAGSYLETYLVGQRLPLILAQLLNHLNGAKYPLAIVLLVGLFTRYPSSRWLIVGWIGVMGVLTLVRVGNRTDMALLVMSVAMLYHLLVRPIPPARIGFGVAAGLVLFIGFGMFREGLAGLSWNPFLYPAEFDILFGNAVELQRAHGNGSVGVLSPTFYLADFAALLPQQIAPFQKVDPAVWYVTTFYPEFAARGGGLAFGTMAEAVLTGGWLSAAARGGLLGLCFAAVHRLYMRRPSYWVLVFYVWVTTLSYQSFRATTFYLLTLFAFRFLPVMFGVRIAAAALNRAAHRTKFQMLFPMRKRRL